MHQDSDYFNSRKNTSAPGLTSVDPEAPDMGDIFGGGQSDRASEIVDVENPAELLKAFTNPKFKHEESSESSPMRQTEMIQVVEER